MKLLFLEKFYCTFFILFQLLPFASFNQSLIGLKIIYSNNYLQTDISNRSETALRCGNGVGAGISFNSKLNNNLYVQSSFEAVTKSYHFERLGAYKGVFQNHSNTYLQVPVVLKYIVFKRNKWCLTLDGGFYSGFWISGKIKGSTPNIFHSTNDTAVINGSTTQYLQLESYSEKYKFNKERDRRIEIGGILGLALNYHLKKNVLTASVNYCHSFTNQLKISSQTLSPRLNRTLMSSLEFFFDLNDIF